MGSELDDILNELDSDGDDASHDVNIEDILREDDSESLGLPSPTAAPAPAPAAPAAPAAGGASAAVPADILPPSLGLEAHYTHNPEDWAMLEQILRENDDDDDELDDAAAAEAGEHKSPEHDADSIIAGAERLTAASAQLDALLSEPLTPTSATAGTPSSAQGTDPQAQAQTDDDDDDDDDGQDAEDQDGQEESEGLARVLAREMQLKRVGNTEMVTPLQVKRRLRPRPRSRTRSVRRADAEAPAAALHVGVGGGVVRVKPMAAISRQLEKNAQYRQHGPGLPTVVSIHNKFIAVGTSRSLVLVFDHFEEVRQVLGTTGDASGDGPVTAIDVSRGSDFLVCGYASGRVVLWDIMKGTALKAVSDAHDTPITSVRFYKDKTASVVSVDTRGMVNKLHFSKMLMVYMADVECLLDGAAGQIPAVSVLHPFPGGPGAGHPSDGFSLIALSSNKSTFVVAVEPDVRVIYKWPRPEGVDPTAAVLPSLSWGWAMVKGAGGQLTPVLARAWGRHLQLLQGSFAGEWPEFSVVDELEATEPVVALDWLGEQVLAYMNERHELCVFDTMGLTELEIIDISAIQLVFATYKRGAPRAAEDEEAKEVARAATTASSFQNSFRACEGTLYLLGYSELQVAQVQSWTQRIDTLVSKDGEWLEALALALDHYESTVRPIEEERLAAGRVGLSTDSEKVASLLLEYLNIAISNAPPADPDAGTDFAQSHYQMLGGVCIEYCVSIRRIDLLFGPVFQAFKQAGCEGVFSELLEPYILNDKLGHVGAEALQAFAAHYRATDRLPQVERCLLHLQMDPEATPAAQRSTLVEIDFHTVLRLCKQHRLYSALIHVYSSGLKDFVAPLEVLLGTLVSQSTAGSQSDDDDDDVGYKALLYLRCCMTGRRFPGRGRAAAMEPAEAAGVRAAVLRFLFSTVPDRAERIQVEPLLAVDAAELLRVLTLGFTAEGAVFLESSSAPNVDDPHLLCPSRQVMVDELSAVIRREGQAWGPFFLFVSPFVVDGVVRLESELLSQLLRFLAEGSVPGCEPTLVRLLRTAPREARLDELLPIVRQSGFQQAAAILYRNSGDFGAAVRAYLDAPADAGFRSQVFAYVRAELARARVEQQPDGPLREVVLANVARMIAVDCAEAVALMLELFPADTDAVLEHLAADPESQLAYLHQLASPPDPEAPSDGAPGPGPGAFKPATPAAPIVELTMDQIKQYIELLGRFRPQLVYPFLSTHDNYPLDECLRICQQHRITGATAYLLERTGDVPGALRLILSDVADKLRQLDPAVVLRQSRRSKAPNSKWFETADDGAAVLADLTVAIELCQRQSTHQDEGSAQLWFSVLDTLVQAQGNLKRGLSKQHSHVVQNTVNDFVRLVLERMTGYVSLPAILQKITQDHAEDSFGEFRDTIVGMLDTSRYEATIFSTANSLLAHDLYRSVQDLHRGQARGLASDALCMGCRHALQKPPPHAVEAYMPTCVYVCGHGFHEVCAPDGRCPLCSGASGASAAAGLGAGAGAGAGAGDDDAAGNAEHNPLPTESSDAPRHDERSTQQYLRRLMRKTHHASREHLRPLQEIYSNLDERAGGGPVTTNPSRSTALTLAPANVDSSGGAAPAPRAEPGSLPDQPRFFNVYDPTA